MTDKPIKATLDSSDDSVKTQKPILIQLDDIPTPTEDDNGKVLGVDEGKYTLVQGGGGGGAEYITVVDDPDNALLIVNKTLSEMYQLFSSGKTIYFIVPNGSDQYISPGTLLYSEEYPENGRLYIHNEYSDIYYYDTNNNYFYLNYGD